MSPEMMRRNLRAKISQLTGRQYNNLDKMIGTLDFETAHEFYRLVCDLEDRERQAKRITHRNISQAIRRGLR